MSPDEPTLTLARLARVLEKHTGGELSLAHYRVLGLLARGDERISRLAARLDVTKPTLTAIVENLVERGYLRRESADGDRRVVRLSLTEAGAAAMQTSGGELRALLDDLLARCADPGAVVAALDDLRNALDERWSERLAARAEQGVAGR